MQSLVEPGSFVWGFVSGAAFTFVGVMTWALCASAKMGDEAVARAAFEPKNKVPVTLDVKSVGKVTFDSLDAEARQYEQAESMGRDLPPAA